MKIGARKGGITYNKRTHKTIQNQFDLENILEMKVIPVSLFPPSRNQKRCFTHAGIGKMAYVVLELFSVLITHAAP
jgi:hypothetical protein